MALPRRHVVHAGPVQLTQNKGNWPRRKDPDCRPCAQGSAFRPGSADLGNPDSGFREIAATLAAWQSHRAPHLQIGVLAPTKKPEERKKEAVVVLKNGSVVSVNSVNR